MKFKSPIQNWNKLVEYCIIFEDKAYHKDFGKGRRYRRGKLRCKYCGYKLNKEIK